MPEELGFPSTVWLKTRALQVTYEEEKPGYSWTLIW